MAATIDVESLIEQGAELKVQRTEVFAAVAANRTMLRALGDAGQLDESQLSIVDELYPKKAKGMRSRDFKGRKLIEPMSAEDLEGMSDDELKPYLA